jgi:hypothetical protein
MPEFSTYDATLLLRLLSSNVAVAETSGNVCSGDINQLNYSKAIADCTKAIICRPTIRIRCAFRSIITPAAKW